MSPKTIRRLGYVKGEPRKFIPGHANIGRRYGPTIPKPPPPNPSGLCECGCGTATPVAAYTSRRDGTVYGEHIRFVRGHNSRLRSVVWFHRTENRWYVYCREPPKREAWARIVLRNKLGRELAPREHAHHINEDTTDDRPENLEALGINEHHKLHRARERVRRSTASHTS